MKSFLSGFLGTVLAMLVVAGLAVGVGSCVANRKPPIEDGSHLLLTLYDDLPEYDPPGGALSALSGGDVETLTRVLDNLDKAAVDDRIDGVVLKIAAGGGPAFAKIQELHDAFDRFRASGKSIRCWIESMQTSEVLLAAACDERIAPPTAYIQFHGFSGGSMHVKRALDKLGIRADLHKIRDYKAAAELVTRESMSEPARENRDWMMDEMWGMALAMLEERLGMSAEDVERHMTHALFTGEEAVAAGLLDRLAYWDEIAADFEDEDGEQRVVASARYAQVDRDDLDLTGDRTIAVIHAQGTIAGRTSGVNPLLGVTMGHETITRELRRAREDEDVAAIVLRVDSPGGDALASDLMGHEVEITAEVKPVIVSMVGVAASGGYHIAYRGSRIVANPATVTGSIGSISGKFNLAGLNDKIGVTYDVMSRGPMAGIDSSLHDYTPAERERFEANHWASFNAWLRDVAEHRGLAFEEAETLAHGRVWSGRQAAGNLLIDELGGFHRAVGIAREMAEIPEDETVTLAHFPEKKGLLESLLSGDRAATAAAARWMVHRSIRSDVEETLTILGTDPDVGVRALVGSTP
jgi:protease-4